MVARENGFANLRPEWLPMILFCSNQKFCVMATTIFHEGLGLGLLIEELSKVLSL